MKVYCAMYLMHCAQDGNRGERQSHYRWRERGWNLIIGRIGDVDCSLCIEIMNLGMEGFEYLCRRAREVNLHAAWINCIDTEAMGPSQMVIVSISCFASPKVCPNCCAVSHLWKFGEFGSWSSPMNS